MGHKLSRLGASGLMPPATRQPAPRNAMMIGAHVVWGAALGLNSHLRGATGALKGTPEVGRPWLRVGRPRRGLRQTCYAAERLDWPCQARCTNRRTVPSICSSSHLAIGLFFAERGEQCFSDIPFAQHFSRGDQLAISRDLEVLERIAQ